MHTRGLLVGDDVEHLLDTDARGRDDPVVELEREPDKATLKPTPFFFQSRLRTRLAISS
jgi:hypothetical protein